LLITIKRAERENKEVEKKVNTITRKIELQPITVSWSSFKNFRWCGRSVGIVESSCCSDKALFLKEVLLIMVIADLLNLFTQQDPNIDHDEAISLIKEIINSIRKTLDNILVVVSFQPLQQHLTNHMHMTKFFSHDLKNALKLQITTEVVK
jgi:hypothetical protein